MNTAVMDLTAGAKSFADNRMLSRKDGHVGYVIYNNPQKHNAVSLDMWQAAVGILDDFEKFRTVLTT